VAVKNWNNFVNNMFFALKTIIDITGLKPSDALEKMDKPVKVENKTPKS
jgi:hypothetical protein